MGFWDSYEGDYESLFDGDPVYAEALRMVIDLAGDLSGKTVLDLGCGAGALLFRLVEMYPGAEILGVDPSEKMVRRCERKLGKVRGARVRRGTATAIPFPEAYVDAVLSNLALHHVPPGEREGCARELARVLRPGGRLVYADMFCDVDAPPEDPERCRDIIHKMVGKSLYDREHGAYRTMLLHLGDIPAVLTEDGEHFTTEGVWRKALARAGFADLEVFPVPPGEFGYRVITGTKPPDLPGHERGLNGA